MMLLMMMKFLFVLAVFHLQIVAFAEICDDSPFVSSDVKSQAVKTVPADATKVYTTTLTLIPSVSGSSFDQQLFIDSVSALYEKSLDGFQEVKVKSDTVVDGNFQVKYTASYLYRDLRPTGTNLVVASTIGGVSYISDELAKDPTFADEYEVSGEDGNFVFQENTLCAEVTCFGDAEYMECDEDGLDIACQSVCCRRVYCQHEGYCFHDDPASAATCSCVVGADHWYVGANCELYLHVWMLVLSGVALVLALVFIVGFFVYKILKLKKKTLIEVRRELEVMKSRRESKKHSKKWQSKNIFSWWKKKFGKNTTGGSKQTSEPVQTQRPPLPTITTTPLAATTATIISTPPLSEASTKNSVPVAAPRRRLPVATSPTPTQTDESVHDTTSQSSFDSGSDRHLHRVNSFTSTSSYSSLGASGNSVDAVETDEHIYSVPYELDEYNATLGLVVATETPPPVYFPIVEPMITTV